MEVKEKVINSRELFYLFNHIIPIYREMIEKRALNIQVRL